MSDTDEDPDVEDEELLDGQNVFKGPRKLRKNLLGRTPDEDD